MSKYLKKDNTFKNKLMDAVTKLNIMFKQQPKINHNTLQLLEPMSAIIRLAMLCFESHGTKISIYNNRIYKQYPGLLQGTIRWTYGNKRNQLHNLYKPILMATKFYSNDNEYISTIFKYAIQGLSNLNNTYLNQNGDIVCHSIKLYKEILNKSNNENRDKIDYETDEITTKLYEKFNNLWSTNQLKIIADLLNQANKKNNETPYFLEAINCILQIKENTSVEIINKFTENITK